MTFVRDLNNSTPTSLLDLPVSDVTLKALCHLPILRVRQNMAWYRGGGLGSRREHMHIVTRSHMRPSVFLQNQNTVEMYVG